MRDEKKGSYWKGFFLGGIVIFLLLFFLHYHIILYFGDNNLFVIYPKTKITFTNTFVDISEWGVKDYWKNRDVFRALSVSTVKLFYSFIAGEMYTEGQEDIMIGALKEDNFFYILGEENLFCFKF